MRVSRPAPRSGLTLLEVLVALTIFLFSFVAISGLISQADEISREIEWESEGTRLAQSKLEEVTAGVVPLAPVGETPFDQEPDWNWSLDAQPDVMIPNLWTVTVRITRQRRDGSLMEMTLTRMIIDPSTRGNLAPAPAAEEPLPEEPTETPQQ